MGLFGFECPLTQGWKETAPLTRKFWFKVKLSIYLKPCMYLKSENVNIENVGTTGENFWYFQILHSKMGKWTYNELTSPKEILPHSPTPPPPTDIKNILKPPENPKFQLPLTLAGEAHCTYH